MVYLVKADFDCGFHTVRVLFGVGVSPGPRLPNHRGTIFNSSSSPLCVVSAVTDLCAVHTDRNTACGNMDRLSSMNAFVRPHRQVIISAIGMENIFKELFGTEPRLLAPFWPNQSLLSPSVFLVKDSSGLVLWHMDSTEH